MHTELAPVPLAMDEARYLRTHPTHTRLRVSGLGFCTSLKAAHVASTVSDCAAKVKKRQSTKLRPRTCPAKRAQG